ncbi:MAG: response regulator transcription factor [Clostridia bacterium]|nr:response regulator transcription factor [Clostridia bacterium]
MKILFAEDEKQLSDAVCVLLKHNGFTVDPVYNGEDALYCLMDGGYDGAILDIMMPKMDGVTVLRKIREKKINIPVIMLTAKGEIDDKVEALNTGADDYLVKPFATRELLARLRAITRRREVTLGNELTFGNVTLGRETFELKANDNAIRLSNKEFQLMECLMLNHNALISTERIMEKVWGFDSDSEINVVWVYISALRKKLAELNADISIKAVRGLGYTLELTK